MEPPVPERSASPPSPAEFWTFVPVDDIAQLAGDPARARALIATVQRARDAGTIHADEALHFILHATEQMIAEAARDDPVLTSIDARLEEIERAHGLRTEQGEYWKIGEGPPEYDQGSLEWERRFDDLWAALLRE